MHFPAHGWTISDHGGGTLEVRGTFGVPDISGSIEYEVSRRGQELWLIAIYGRLNSGEILTAGAVHHRGWFQDLPPGVYRVHVWLDFTNPYNVDHNIHQVFDQKISLR